VDIGHRAAPSPILAHERDVRHETKLTPYEHCQLKDGDIIYFGPETSSLLLLTAFHAFLGNLKSTE